MDECEQKLRRGELLEVKEIEDICSRAIEIFITEPNIQNIPAPAKVCGDIHGQFYDLLNIFRIHGTPKNSRFVFLGDYVDRGFHSLECILILLIYKIKHPENVVLLRGNHENFKICKFYGFYDEVLLKYKNANVWRIVCEVFSFLNIGCIISGRVFCVHGGISENTTSIDSLQAVDRIQTIIEDELINDLLWSDPKSEGTAFEYESSTGITKNRRGQGVNFGIDIAHHFLEFNDMVRIVRSHQMANRGYKFNFPDRSCVTVWSAPNYCYRHANLASVMDVKSDMVCEEYSFSVFMEVENQKPGYESVISLKTNN